MQSDEQAQHDNQSNQPGRLEQHTHNNLPPRDFLPRWKTAYLGVYLPVPFPDDAFAVPFHRTILDRGWTPDG